jgi:hypothetical protein
MNKNIVNESAHAQHMHEPDAYINKHARKGHSELHWYILGVVIRARIRTYMHMNTKFLPHRSKIWTIILI